MSDFRVLLVEDNPADVFLVEEALRKNQVPYKLARFESGEDALAALDRGIHWENSVAAAPDIVVLDLNTPRMDGLEFLRIVREKPQLRQIPIAVLTSSQSPADRRDANALGAACFIRKPARLQQFLSEVGISLKSLLEGKRAEIHEN